MVTSEDIQATRSNIRKKVQTWKKENPEWDTSDSMNYLESKVSKNTYKSYRAILPLFLH